MISGEGWVAVFAEVEAEADGGWDLVGATRLDIIAWEETSSSHAGPPRIVGWVTPEVTDVNYGELLAAPTTTLVAPDGRVQEFVRYERRAAE